MKLKICVVLFTALFVNGAGLATAQDGSIEADKMMVLKPAETRLAELSKALNLTKTQKTKIKAILKNVDASVRKRVADGNAKILAVLDEEQSEDFVGIEGNGSCNTQSSRPQLMGPQGGMNGTERMGQQGPKKGMGQKGGNPPGGMPGAEQRDMQGMDPQNIQKMLQQGMVQKDMNPAGGGKAPMKNKKCGDGVCDQKEQANPQLCPQDCEEEEE